MASKGDPRFEQRRVNNMLISSQQYVQTSHMLSTSMDQKTHNDIEQLVQRRHHTCRHI